MLNDLNIFFRQSENALTSLNPSKELEMNIQKALTDEQVKIETQRNKLDNIDENALYLCNNVWAFLKNPIEESDERNLNKRLTEIQVNKSNYFTQN